MLSERYTEGKGEKEVLCLRMRTLGLNCGRLKGVEGLPGSPVIRTLSLYCGVGCRFRPGWETRILQAMQHGPTKGRLKGIWYNEEGMTASAEADRTASGKGEG